MPGFAMSVKGTPPPIKGYFNAILYCLQWLLIAGLGGAVNPGFN